MLHYKLFNNDLLLLLQEMRVGMSIGHIDCCVHTCADDVVLLAMTTLCLLLIVYVVNYICHERYIINAKKSVDVMLNEDPKPRENRPVILGSHEICKSQSKVHLGVNCNEAGRVDFDIQAGAYGCSGVTTPLAAHICKTFALPRMTYSLELHVFQLCEEEIAQFNNHRIGATLDAGSVIVSKEVLQHTFRLLLVAEW